MVKLLTTDTAFNLFNLLKLELDGKVNNLSDKNLIFTEEKISMMTERFICDNYSGSFNTDVYSFGRFLRTRTSEINSLSKECSAMVIKRILNRTELNCFSHSKLNLAPTLYDLVAQLKSAKVSPQILKEASENTSGILKNKLIDIVNVYSEYENYLESENYEDQSSMLKKLPEIIDNDQSFSDADVYLVGYSGWTAQQRQVIESIVKKAKNVIAILVSGKNTSVYVNETKDSFLRICKELGKEVLVNHVETERLSESKYITNNLFSPYKEEGVATDNIFAFYAHSKLNEAEIVAKCIKHKVINEGLRYKDFTICVPNVEEYKDELERALSLLEVPYFIDCKVKPINHPIIRLIVAFLDAKRFNLERGVVVDFCKNVLIDKDDSFKDEFENYLIKYNVDYNRFLEPLPEDDNEKRYLEFEEFRKEIIELLNVNDPIKLLEKLDVKGKTEKLTEKLLDNKIVVESAINAQMYDKVSQILTDIKRILNGVYVGFLEYKNIFLSGVNALEISVLPQYLDAVFIGGYREVSLAKAKHLYCMGLNESVPKLTEDVSIITDGDINVLEKLKVVIEPKIRIVNHRERENLALALASFSHSLTLSYSIIEKGDKHTESEVYTQLKGHYRLNRIKDYSGYLSKRQGTKNFARACGEFAEGKINDFSLASSFYYANFDRTNLDRILIDANKEIKKKLELDNPSYLKNGASPTLIEGYYCCPYKTFLTHGVKLRKREEGQIDVMSFGTILHSIFEYFIKNVNRVVDKESSDRVVEEGYQLVSQNKDVKRFLLSDYNYIKLDGVKEEAKKQCYNIYLKVKDSQFKKFYTEVSIGGENGYPAVKLLDGKVNLKGKVDRVDVSDNGFRIIDYKTGSATDDVKKLFNGTKLQLYLYSQSVKEKEGKPLGIYYQKSSDEFIVKGKEDPAVAVGKTLNDNRILSEKDLEFGSGLIEEETLNAYLEYAVKVSENAVLDIMEGVILPSPSLRMCEYCEYLGMCQEKTEEREELKVNDNTIIDAVKGEDVES